MSSSASIVPFLAYGLAVCLDPVLVFMSLNHIITIDDLKSDYKNPIDVCQRLNPLVLPEYVIHLVFTIGFLMSNQWFSLLINIPVIVYHVYRYDGRPVMSEPGIYDPTCILNGQHLRRATVEGWTKLVFYLMTFFYYLFAMIYTLVQYIE
ncbi:protein cornichon-like [Oppia nitens]|uniref:protein cornichon-like n=1 Tax=Oppia nitens TaxID=1686743 RepID=UPI0023DA3631|nr:protein cornichon-like [Oppia nitens]